MVLIETLYKIVFIVKYNLPVPNFLISFFEKIDSRLVVEKLKAEQRNHQVIGSKMKKIIKLPDLPERLSALLAY
jgi:hypothetical protein